MPRNNSGGAKSRKTAGLDATTSALADKAVTAPLTTTAEPVREVPAPDPFQCGSNDPSHPPAEDEPVLGTGNIQGNILGGFNKDFQVLLFVELKNRRVPAFKAWLERLTPFIATTAEVVTFNRLFKAIRARRQSEPAGVRSTWINVAFSFAGLQKISNKSSPEVRRRLQLEEFTDEAFTKGLTERSPLLGDPTDGSAGDPANWTIGGRKHPVDVVIIVAGDDENEVEDVVRGLLSGGMLKGDGLESFGRVIRQDGRNLPAADGLAGHEHFGFLDGVSQPGVRGRLSEAPGDVLTLRQNPNSRGQGKPGQELIWPGEFVFGYPGGEANPEDDPRKPFEDPGPVSTAGPAWTDDGSFLVFRRLRQDVSLFHNFLRDSRDKLRDAKGNPSDLTADLMGARCVGRWRSGAPVERTISDDSTRNDADDPILGANDCANNNFEFQEGTEPLPRTSFDNPFDCTDEIPKTDGLKKFLPANEDGDGLICPFTGHIRKAYPRDDRTLDPDNPFTKLDGDFVRTVEGNEKIQLNEDDTQTHRMLRRGIPFGEPLRHKNGKISLPDAPANDDGGDRGLLFLAYQTSIEDQFEFIIKNWVNNPDFKEPSSDNGEEKPANERGGHDPIIGQNARPGEGRVREFTVTFKNDNGEDTSVRLTTDSLAETRRDWVIPTGGEYFFAPSIEGLRLLATPN